MLIINLSNINHRFIIAKSAFGLINLSTVMEIYSDFDKKEYSIPMVANTSLFSERFNEFIFPSVTFNVLIPGVYSWKIKDAGITTTIVNGQPVLSVPIGYTGLDLTYSVGMLKVIDDELTLDEELDEQYISIEPAASADDYVVFD